MVADVWACLGVRAQNIRKSHGKMENGMPETGSGFEGGLYAWGPTLIIVELWGVVLYSHHDSEIIVWW